MFSTSVTLPAIPDDGVLQDLAGMFSALGIPFSVSKESGPDSLWEACFISENLPDTGFFEEIMRQNLKNPAFFPEKWEWKTENLPDRDWLAHSYRQFPPFSVGPFFIHGSHYEGETPEGQTPLQIDAATAFGSGEHGTTKGCLQAMLDLKGRGACPWNVLDMGTGSGILAIAAWKLWKTPVLAVDNDPEAVRMAGHHRQINNVPEGPTEMTCACGDGFHEELTQKRKPYDLVIANILAGTLKEMAADLKAVSDENGYVILSGILNEQAPGVIACYEGHGLKLKNRIEIGEWSTLVLQNTAA